MNIKDKAEYTKYAGASPRWEITVIMSVVLAAAVLTAATSLAKQKNVDASPQVVLVTEGKDKVDLKQLWAYGLISRRTGEPLINKDGWHRMDPSKVSYGYNVVTDRNGKIIRPSGKPLQGGEQLILTEEYQQEKNVREYARVYSIMAPIRDAILYDFKNTSMEKWLDLTKVLTANNIKAQDTSSTRPRRVLSSKQVYEYVAGNPTAGSPVMRFLEEAELELKCLAFVDYDFTNPSGRNHAKEHNIDVGSGIKMP